MNSRLAPGLSPLRIQLDNGLDVAVLHQPGLPRTAAALRRATGGWYCVANSEPVARTHY
ncbi:hypothetical protein [Pseudomonas sp. BN411]|uniref:hypothetical protein n=1 Tax=Pseudomonas sp. BN411 TaxID=2567887 RepID=UPI002458B382|nr:hypothetical protein [Pseudomonas sp. BN411]